MTPKEIIANDYNSIIAQLNIAQKEIINLFANNTKVQEVQTEYVKAIEKDIASSKNLMHETLEGMVWNNLVIAFFGETNAGKSTIIETMRVLFDEKRKKRMKGSTAGIDGMIIGDGSPDYTKVYDEYKLNVHGKPVILIDVPGIEGKEEDFIDDIKRALKQAHVVFYVQGENKKPDAVIAAKIKKYLNDWVNVYSIYNIKGKEGNYDETYCLGSSPVVNACSKNDRETDKCENDSARVYHYGAGGGGGAFKAVKDGSSFTHTKYNGGLGGGGAVVIQWN